MSGIKMGRVEKYINDYVDNGEPMLFCLLDPADQTPEKAAALAKEAEEGGAKIILIGGSVGAQGNLLDKTAKLIKENTSIPSILFPGNIATVTKHADAMYFMNLFNSRNPYWLSTAQISASPIVKRLGIEPIPTCYMVVEPGGTVGWVGDANLLLRDKHYVAAAAALAGQYLGARLIVTDSGSGAPTPAPPKFIKAVASVLDVPFVYGGGVKTPAQAKDIIKAGANAIQIGTAFEGKSSIKKSVESFVKAMNQAKKKVTNTSNLEKIINHT